MNKIWLDSYPAGMPHEIDAHAYSSLKALLEQSCRQFGEKPAFTNMGVSISYRELDRLSRDFGCWLQARGLRRADRVAIMLPNLLQYPVALFGALRAGMVVVNVNPLYTASELAHELADSGATAIIVLENFAHTVERALRKTGVRHVVTTQVGDLFPLGRRWMTNLAVKHIRRLVPRWSLPNAVSLRNALAQGRRLTLENHDLGHADVAFLQYTGGTTGRPKGAVLTHGNMVANVEQTAAWIGGTLTAGAETVVTALPLYHIFALTANLLVFLKLGARDVLITNPRDIPGLVAELKRTRFTAITGVNTLFSALLGAESFAQVRTANRGALKVAVAGGMAVQRTVAERWQQLMGVPLVEGYGLTEASPIVCANLLTARHFSGTIGLPVPSTEVAILGEQGDEVGLGEVGEICVRGPQVMRGYWNAPEETARVFNAGGWLLTGDMGSMDARGFITFADRRKDVIVVSGFKAYPSEIEDVVMLHPGVKDAGAVGIPDERSGEAVVLFVVRKDPHLTAAAVLAHCRQHLTGYKLPRRIEFRHELPKTLLGKILRRELKAQAAHPHAEYPAQLVRQHRLRDGRTVTIRPVRPDDEALEREFVNKLSGESRYLRFQKWVHAPSDKLIHFLTDIDYDKHLALVCTLPRAGGEELMGEARYVADAAGKDCEFGIMIADSMHKTGIAGLLMGELISAARARGLAMMEGQVLSRNSTMLRFARRLGFEIRRMPDDPRTTRIVKRL